jgi:predicted nucleic acid-binding Zn ribbon protein
MSENYDLLPAGKEIMSRKRQLRTQKIVMGIIGALIVLSMIASLVATVF